MQDVSSGTEMGRNDERGWPHRRKRPHSDRWQLYRVVGEVQEKKSAPDPCNTRNPLTEATQSPLRGANLSCPIAALGTANCFDLDELQDPATILTILGKPREATALGARNLD